MRRADPIDLMRAVFEKEYPADVKGAKRLTFQFATSLRHSIVRERADRVKTALHCAPALRGLDPLGSLP